MVDLTWKLLWEADLTRAEHDSLSALFRRFYPHNAHLFEGGKSWAGARPEGRIVGFRVDEPLAHLGFLRRALRYGDGLSVPIADVGLVGIDPSLQRSGVGVRMLEEATATLRGLEVGFAFLTCREEVVPFYERGGWVLVPGITTRMIGYDGVTEEYTGPSMALPVTASMEGWPGADVFTRDGLEV